MKNVIALAVASLAFVSASGIQSLVQDDSGSITKTVNGKTYTFTDVSDILGDDVSISSDASWWFTPDKYETTKIPVTISSQSLGNIGTIEVTPNDSIETLRTVIDKKVGEEKGENAKTAYATAITALATALKASIDTSMLKEQMQTVGRTLQANLISDVGGYYEDFTASDGSKFRVYQSVDETKGLSKTISQLKQFRNSFTTKSGGKDVTVSKASAYQQGVVKLTSSGDSVTPDGYSITNFSYWSKGKHITNAVALTGWWADEYRTAGAPKAENICDFNLGDFATKDSERDPDFNKHFLLTRTWEGQMHYLPMTNYIKAAVKVDNISLTTNDDAVVSLHSFTNGEHDAEITIGDILTADKDDNPTEYYYQTNAYVVVRTHEIDGNKELCYVPVGNLGVKQPDEKSIAVCEIGANSNKLEIAGFAAATNTTAAVGSAFSDKIFSSSSSSILVPVKNGDSLNWLNLGNYDINETAAGLTATAYSNAQGIVERKFELANWSEVTNQAASAYSSIADILGGGDKKAATNLMILAKSIDASRLEYIMLGDLTVGADEQSIITTNKIDETTGKSNTVHSIYGFFEAKNGQMPMKVVDGDDEKIVWTNVTASASNFVDNATIQKFRVSGDTNDVLSIKGFFSEEKYPERTLDHILGEGEDDDDDQTYQVLTRIKDQDAVYGETNGFKLVYLDIKDGLVSTNWKRRVSGPDGGYTGNHMPFSPAGTNVNGTAAVTGVALNPDNTLDGGSVTTNAYYKLQIAGFDIAPNGTHLVKENGKIGWMRHAVADWNIQQDDGSFLQSTREYETCREGSSQTNLTITVYGFKEAQPFSIPSACNLSAGDVGMKYINWVTATGVVTNDGTKLTLQNYDSAVADAVATKGADGKLAWNKPQIADEKSVTTNTTIGAVTAGQISLRGFATASNNQMPKLVVEGDSRRIEWIDKPSADFDDASITTNTENGATSANTASIYGFSTADANTAPFKTAQGKIEWKAAGGVAAIDDVTISTNEVNHANQLAIKGAYTSENANKALFSTGNGSKWVGIDYGLTVDSSSQKLKPVVNTSTGIEVQQNENGIGLKFKSGGKITADSTNGLQIDTSGAYDNSVLMKTENGLAWVTCESVDVIVGSEYDTSTHEFKNKKKKLLIICPDNTIPETEDVSTPVFTATEHDQD